MTDRKSEMSERERDAGSVIPLPLSVVRISGGYASLGSWGTLTARSYASARLQLKWSEDVEMPAAVAADITSGVLLLNEEAGRLLFLPYASEMIVAYDLKEGEPLYPPVVIQRNDDLGLRWSFVRVVPGGGALYLTETTLARFSGDCTLVWRVNVDYGWAIDGITDDRVLLVFSDGSGREIRQSRALADGALLS